MIPLADTSCVLVVSNAKDAHHQRCTAVYHQQELIHLPQTTLAEIAYMMQRDQGTLPFARFLLQMPRSRYRILALDAADFHRTGYLLQQYADSRLDFVDASIIAVAERLNITRILTLDQRDFNIVRPRHTPYLELLPN